MNLSINRYMALAIMGVLVVGSLSLSAVAFAEPKNGWGEATSERATEQDGIGDHSSDPDGNGVPGNDNQHTDDNDNNHRSGIGNVAEAFTDQKNPDELGDLLDCLDEDVDPDDC